MIKGISTLVYPIIICGYILRVVPPFSPSNFMVSGLIVRCLFHFELMTVREFDLLEIAFLNELTQKFNLVKLIN